MNPELLLTHFDRVSAAPDAIAKLRGFILDLAVRGKLVEQNLMDEPAAELMNRVAATNSQLGKSAGPVRLDAIGAENVPFKIPSNWVWVRLRDICSKTGSGSTPRGGKSVYQPDGVPFLRSQNVHDDGLRLDDVAYISQHTHEKMSGTAVEPGDLLLNITGGSIGRCCSVPAGIGQANVSQHVAIIRVAIGGLQGYLHQLILSPYFQSFVFSEQTGAGRGGLPKNRMDRIPVALPPLAEQQRIVSRVNELMALCDRLASAKAEQETRRDKLVAASHHYLNNGMNAADLPIHAHFSLSHLSTITARPEHIPAIRRTILSLSVRGQLVSQDPTDESVSELLMRIQAEKATLIKEGLLRREKRLAAIADDEVPFAVPTTWRWVRIGTCSLLTDYGTSVKSDQVADGVPILAMGNIQDGRVVLSDRRRVPHGIDDLPQLFLKRFDLLYNRTNSAELVGKTGIYLGDDDAYTFASYLIRIRFLNNLTSPIYANLAMNAPYFRATQIVPELQQQCGQANVNGSKLRNMMIPFPPLAEQHRIVAKVDELMAVCDRLEGQLTTIQTESSRLLAAALHLAFSDDPQPEELVKLAALK
jgi:type I restriction enzyme S subunit